MAIISSTARLRVAFIAIVLAPFCISLHAQFNTPSIDGVIQPGEYGNTQNGTNQIGTNTAQTWYMTWDVSNLYVGITNANLSEGAVIYIDANPVNPPNGGTNANGNLTGFNYDGEEISTLPFRAQFVTYFKDGYREYRKSDGNGNWTNSAANYGSFADGGNGTTNIRELAIPWSAITGAGMPSSFLFLGLLTSSGGYVYGQVPNDNGGAFIGISATYTQYFVVNSTANGASTPPFSIENSSSSVSFLGLYHNTFVPYYRSQEGAVPAGTTVTLRLQTAHLGATGVTLRVYLFDTASGNTTGPLDSPMAFYQTQTVNGTPYDYYTIDYATPTTPTIVYYKFVITNGSGTAYYSDDYIDDYDNLNKDGTGAAAATEPFDSFQITAYDPNFKTPVWMANANVYHIFPDRFRNGDPTNDYCVPKSTAGCPSFYGAPPSSNIAVTTWNTQLCDPNNQNLPCYNNFGSIFYGGDLLGIQNELDYIQGLGFDTLYLNPIFYGNSNHRYDTDDFLNIDPALGGNAALTSLVTAMNQRGMRVILDGTFEDASSDSIYFNEYNKFSTVGACQSLTSQWRSWFQFLDNNVPCNTTDYVGWDGFTSLPLVNPALPAVQNFFFSGTDNVMLHWYNLGAGGWRFDSAPNIPNYFWHALRPYAKTYNPNGPLIGEIWPNASQWLAGDQMDSVMNYRFRRNVTGFVRWPYNWVDNNDNGSDAIIPLTPSQFDNANRAVRDDYPLQATAAMMDLIDSHDTNRALYVMTELGDTGLVQAKQRLELAALFQFTYIGAPTVFYGDEAAINAPSLYSSSSGPVGDPYTRAPYPWTDQPGDPAVYGPPDQSVIAYYRALGHLRKQHPALVSGTFTTLLTGDTQQPSAANTYAYARSIPGGETAIVALNNGSSSNTPVIPIGAYFPDGTTLQDAIGGAIYTISGGKISLMLNAISGVVLLPAPASVDLTPPIANLSLVPAANGNGWNNTSPVTVKVTASDTGSGVNRILYWIDSGGVSSAAGSTASASVSGAGAHTVGVRVLDNAGNISQQYTQAVNIELTPPSVAITGVTNHATYSYGSVPVAGCSTSDALSGVATAATLTLTVSNGSGSATYTATCSGAVDKAGNTAPPVTATYTVTFTGTAPTSGKSCNGSYDGTFKGNLTISTGQNCTFVFGGVTGNIQQNGGSLSLINATVGGNVQVSGGGFTISVTNIKGNLQVQNLPSSPAQYQVCGATVGGDFQYLNNAAAVEIGGGASCAGNMIDGNLQVLNDTAATQLAGNQVLGNVQILNDTGATQVTGNTIGNTLQCLNNTAITGSGNTAKQKQGQCAAF